MPSEHAMERAKADVTRWYHECGFPCDGNDLPALERIYAAAIDAERTVPKGHIRTDDGTEYKISASWGCRASNMTFEATCAAAEEARK